MNISEKGDPKQEKEVAERIWLNYFNRYLFENGSISQKEYARMAEEIASCHNRHRLKNAVN